MHELSLALEVCRLAEEYLEGNDPASLTLLGVEVGDDSNVEPENFRFCLEALLGAPPFGHAEARLMARPGPDLRLAYLEVDDGRSAH
jgi:Zn finger protein HypA/HybF involved in hydrogenase expression